MGLFRSPINSTVLSGTNSKKDGGYLGNSYFDGNGPEKECGTSPADNPINAPHRCALVAPEVVGLRGIGGVCMSSLLGLEIRQGALPYAILPTLVVRTTSPFSKYLPKYLTYLHVPAAHEVHRPVS